MKNSLIARSHNKVIKKQNWIHKTSLTNSEKLVEEYKWFRFVENKLKVPSVSLIKNGYKIEFLDGSNLGEVFWQLSRNIKDVIVSQYIDFFKQTMKFKRSNVKLSDLLVNKFNERIDVLADWQKARLIKEISYYKKHIKSIVTKYENADYFNIMHGDIFLGNTIWNGKTIGIIDPRGAQTEEDIFGNVFYDVIKLAHSLHGKYDQLIFKTKISKNEYEYTSELFFKEIKKIGVSKRDCLVGELGLFISMLPIHQDDKKRQENIITTAKRIYKELQWKK